MRGRSTRIAAVLALAAVLAVVLILVLSDGSSPSGGAGRAPSYSGAATVQRRNLVSTDTESGTLSYADPQTVYNRLSGTVTWLPAVGQVIRPGRALFDVDNQPVLLMNGSEPAYRDLGPSDGDGPDILELNRNLVKLGYDPDGIVDDDQWQAATTAGVEALQEAEGWTENGTLTLGQVVFLPGPQLVGTIDATVGSTGASLRDPGSDDELVSYPRTPGRSSGSTAPGGRSSTGKRSSAPAVAKQLAALKAELKALEQELAHKRSTPKASGSTPASDGSEPAGSSDDSPGGGASATAILQTSSTRLVVTVDLNASLQSEAAPRERVSVEMPDGSTVGGTVSAVSSVAQSSDSGDGGSGDGGAGSGGSGSATIPVTITLDRRAKGAGLDQAAVSVNFTKQTANHVLSVPVTALIATSGQSFAVQEAVAPHKLIPVTTGLFAAGYVQISGPGISSGLRVTDSQG